MTTLRRPPRKTPAQEVNERLDREILGALRNAHAESATAPPRTRARGVAPVSKGPDIGIVTGGGAPHGWTFITVLGRPAPQGSKRLGKFGGMREDNPRTKPWREAIKAVCEHPTLGVGDDFVLWDGPLCAEMTLFFEPPKSAKLGSFPDTRSTYDCDKLARAVDDGITGLIIVDDSRIVDLIVRKRYVWGDSEERAEIKVSPVR